MKLITPLRNPNEYWVQNCRSIYLNNSKIIKFSIGAAFNLSVKLILLVSIGFTGLSTEISYLITHILILFTSYFYHSNITFCAGMDLNNFSKFTANVLFLKIFDYTLFVIFINILIIHHIISLFLTSIVVFILRYFLLDKVVFIGGERDG